MTPIISYPKALFHTLTYCEKKDYVLCCLHEAYKGTNDLYHNQEILKELQNLINKIEEETI